MGKQVNFYLLREDELLFLEFIYSKTDLILIDERSSESRIQIIDDPFLNQPTYAEVGVVLLKNKSVTIDEKYFIRHVGRKYVTELARYIETGGIYYSIDKINAPVIEYWRSKMLPDNRLTRGRIWAEMYELVDQQLVYKGLEFEKSYDRLARWLRRNLFRDDHVPYYVGKEALKWFREGGELMP